MRRSINLLLALLTGVASGMLTWDDLKRADERARLQILIQPVWGLLFLLFDRIRHRRWGKRDRHEDRLSTSRRLGHVFLTIVGVGGAVIGVLEVLVDVRLLHSPREERERWVEYARRLRGLRARVDRRNDMRPLPPSVTPLQRLIQHRIGRSPDMQAFVGGQQAVLGASLLAAGTAALTTWEALSDMEGAGHKLAAVRALGLPVQSLRRLLEQSLLPQHRLAAEGADEELRSGLTIHALLAGLSAVASAAVAADSLRKVFGRGKA